MEQSLDEVIAGDVEPVEKVEEVTDTAPEKVAEDDTKAETTAAKPDKEEKHDIPIAALLDEREKRQAAQKRADELEQKIAALTKSENVKQVSVFEDEEGFIKSFENKLDDARLQDRMDMSREFMGMFKEDYAEREAEFLALAKGDSALIQKLRDSKNPAKFAYDTAVKAQKLKSMENLDEWEAKKTAEIREKVRAEVLSELEAEGEKATSKRNSVTPSLAKGRSTAGTNKVVNDDLDSLLSNTG